MTGADAPDEQVQRIVYRAEDVIVIPRGQSRRFNEHALFTHAYFVIVMVND